MCPNIETHHPRDYTFASEYPLDGFRWSIYGTQGTHSRTHIDAQGFGTHIRSLAGRKLWLIGEANKDIQFFDPRQEENFHKLVEHHVDQVNSTRQKAIEEERDPPSYERIRQPLTRWDDKSCKPCMSGKDGFIDANMKWHAILLQPGDDL